MEEEEGAEPGDHLSGTSCALSLQYEVWETASEFYIRNLFWNTEYCISVEPDVASRHIPAMRTAEQCVTIGHRDGKDGVGLGGPCGTWSAPNPGRSCTCCRVSTQRVPQDLHFPLTWACPLLQKVQNSSRSLSAPSPLSSSFWVSLGLCWSART